MWFPAEQHTQGPGTNWEQVAGLADTPSVGCNEGEQSCCPEGAPRVKGPSPVLGTRDG